MNSIKKVAGWNLVVLLVYSVFIRIVCSGGGSSEAGLGIAIFSAVLIAVHVLVCLVITLSKFLHDEDKHGGRVWLLTTGLVLLIGFSTCLGNMAIPVR